MTGEMIDGDTAAAPFEEARDIAIRYRLTGTPPGIAGEIGEFLAAGPLGLEPAEARSREPLFDVPRRTCRNRESLEKDPEVALETGRAHWQWRNP